MYEVHTTQLDEDTRVVWSYDEWSEFPLSRGYGDTYANVGILTLGASRNSITLESITPEENLLDFHEYHDSLEAVTKHLERQGYKWALGKCRPDKSTWHDYIVYAPEEDENADYLEDAVSAINRWISGEIFVATLQKRVRWTNDVNDDEMDTWETEESIGGIELADTYNHEEMDEYARTAF